MSTVEQDLHERFARGADARPRLTGRLPRQHVEAAQRVRILTAMAALAYEEGGTSATVGAVVGLAGVSRRTFYELFEDRADCLLAAIDHALALAGERAAAAYGSRERWADRVRAGLTALLEFFDEEPQIARLCVVESSAAGPAALARRGEVLDQLARVLDDGRVLARRQPPPLTAEGLVGGALSVVGARIVRGGPERLVELVNPLMSMIVLPYRGELAARKQLTRAPEQSPPAPAPAPHPLESLPMRITYRTLAVLAAISAEPGLSNFQVSERAGIADKGQISRLLARLSDHGLTENTGGGQPMGAANAWHLTARGREVEGAMRRALLDAGRSRAAGRGRVAPEASV